MVKLDHLSLAVGDWKRSRDWYVANLGFKIEFEIPQGGRSGLGVAAIQDDSGFTVFLEQIAEPVVAWQCSYTVRLDDVDSAFERLSAAGLSFVSPPMKQFWGYGAVLSDPDGHCLHLYDEASMAAKG